MCDKLYMKMGKESPYYSTMIGALLLMAFEHRNGEPLYRSRIPFYHIAGFIVFHDLLVYHGYHDKMVKWIGMNLTGFKL